MTNHGCSFQAKCQLRWYATNLFPPASAHKRSLMLTLYFIALVKHRKYLYQHELVRSYTCQIKRTGQWPTLRQWKRRACSGPQQERILVAWKRFSWTPVDGGRDGDKMQKRCLYVHFPSCRRQCNDVYSMMQANIYIAFIACFIFIL